MKKIAFILPLALMLSGCQPKDAVTKQDTESNNPTANVSSDTLFYTKGMELVTSIDKIAENEEYKKLFSASDEVGTIISDMGAEDYATPRAVYKISEIEIAQDTADLSAMPADLQTTIKNKMVGAVPSLLNSVTGTENLAAASIATDSKYFLCDDKDEPCLYLYVYDGNYSSMVAFTPYDENIVGAVGFFVSNSSLNDTSSADNVLQSIQRSGYISNCKVEEVTQ